MKSKIIVIFCLLTIIACFTACKQKNRFAIDLNDNFVEVSVNRFDKDFLLMDTTNMKSEVEKLYNKYQDFFPVFIENILEIEPTDTLLVAEFIREFLSDTTFTSVNEKALKDYENVRDLEKILSVAYTYIHHYFPAVNLPDVYFFVSGFNLSIMMTDRIIAMGTDMYLGSDFPAYSLLTYQYMTANMKRENLVPDLVTALLFRQFPMDSDKGRLIDNMLYRGKVMYLASVFMPSEKDENIIGYTKEQIKWCEKYERKIWAAIIDQKDLFSTDNFLIRKYMNDAPFTSTVSPDSPGRLGTWVGWQIVRSYMQRNENVTLTDLMHENDYQKMLEDSGYRP